MKLTDIVKAVVFMNSAAVNRDLLQVDKELCTNSVVLSRTGITQFHSHLK